MATDKERVDLREKEHEVIRNISNELKKIRQYEDDELDDLKEIRDLYSEISKLKKYSLVLQNKVSDRTKEVQANRENLELAKKSFSQQVTSLKKLEEMVKRSESAYDLAKKNHQLKLEGRGLAGERLEDLKKESDLALRVLNTKKFELSEGQASLEYSESELRNLENKLGSSLSNLNLAKQNLEVVRSEYLAQKESVKWKEKSVDAIKKLKSIGDTLTSPFLILTGLLTLAYKRFVELDEAGKSFRETTKLTKSQSEGIAKEIERVSTTYAYMGIQAKDVADAGASLVDEFGLMNKRVIENAESITFMAKNLGVTNSNAAKFVAYMDRVGGMGKDQIQNMVGFSSQLSKASGVPLDKLMEDVASASDEAKAMTGGQVINLIKASAQARMLGTNLNAVASATRGLLNFNESINSELEASVLLGKNLSFMDARRKAFVGDLAGAQEETLKQVQKMGEFNKLNVLQQEALAKASGYSVSDLQKMIKQKEDFNKLSDEEKNKFNSLMKMKQDAAKNDNSARDALRQMEMQSTMDTLKASLNQLMMLGAQVLLPLVKLLTPIANIFASVAGEVSNLTAKLNGGESSWWGSVAVISALVASFVGLKKIVGLSTGMLGTFGGKLKETLSDKLLKSSSGGGIMDKVKGLFGGGASKGVDAMADTAKKTNPSIGRGFQSFMGSFAKGVSYLGNPSFLKGVLGLALLGASIIPFAFAMKMFSDVSWKDVFIGLGALAAFGVAAIAFGAAAPLIIPGAIAIGALGVALLPFSVAAIAAGAGMNLMADGLSKMVPYLSELASISGGLITAAGAITALGAAFATFGAGQAAGGLMSFVGNLLGGDRIEQLKELAKLGPELKVTADAIQKISTPSSETSSAAGSAPDISNADVVAKLDELISLMKNGGIAVNIDGRLVSNRIAAAIS